MPETNYINPGSIRPAYDWKPSAGLAGMFLSRDRARYENMAGLQDAMMQDAATLSREDVLQGAPGRQATREALLRDLPVKSRGLEATTRGQELGTEFTEATQPGKIGTTNMGQRVQYNAAQMQELQQGLAIAESLANVQGPASVPQIAQLIKQSGMDPNHPVLQSILSGDPRQVGANARKVYQAINQHLQDYRSSMDKTGLEGEYSLERQRIANQGALASAKARTAAKSKSMEQLMNEAKTPVEAVTRAVTALADFEIEPRIKDKARKIIENNFEAYSTLVQKGQIQAIPGLPQIKPLTQPQFGDRGPGQRPGVQRWGRDAQGNPIRLGQ